MRESVQSHNRSTSRRLSKPPLRGFCLACRASRIRCDGQKECSNCSINEIPCCYTSTNGALRNGQTRTHPNMTTSTLSTNQCLPVKDSQLSGAMGTTSVGNGSEWVNQLAGLCGPGAGLRKVDKPMVEIESIFDSIFAPAPAETGMSSPSPPLPNPVQLYGSNEDLLDAYYIFIHPYYPILPPPPRLPVFNRPLLEQNVAFEPSSPLGLALAAILVLVPHANESDPLRPDYVEVRREYAHRFARSAYEAVEKDRPFRDESTRHLLGPHRALFHPEVPLCLEGVIALTMLSVYEYAQRGTMTKMLRRANEAVQAAMSMNLHEAIEDDQFAEARQRAWWTAYITACQAFTVSSTRPTFNPYEPGFVTPYPKGWRLLIESQQALLEAAMFAKDLDQAFKSGSDVSWIPKRLAELDGQISSLLFDCRDNLSMAEMAPPLYSPEAVATKAMRSFAEIKLHSARVKIHRFYAFQDMPVGPKPASDPDTLTTSTSPDDSFRTFISSSIPDIPLSNPSASFASSRIRELDLPFSVHTSSKICLHSTLNVVTLLDDLPYPNLSNEAYPCHPARHLPGTPRSMPTLVCCAMQACWAMLMFCFKARTFQLGGTDGSSTPDTSAVVSFRNELYQALRVVSRCISNYSVGFEALQGMRDEVTRAIEREFAT